MDINKYKEIASYTENNECLGQIESIERVLDKNNFLLSLVGQFSTGKSKLINNILEVELLPVHITETTQVATFIKFSEINNAQIYLKNGKIQNVEIEEIKEFWEGKKQEFNGEVDYIEIGINSKVLRNGLIIGDTPGINTTIKRHEEETRKILKASSACVYVISKPVSDVDNMFIQELLDSGLKLICVRTHMDSINESEEDAEVAVRKDRECIKKITDGQVTEIYHVSNERESAWYLQVERVKDYLKNSLGANISFAREEAYKNRLKVINKKLSKSLEGRKIFLDGVINKKKNNLDEKKEDFNKKKNRLDTILLSRKKIYKREVEDTKKDATSFVNEKVKSIERQLEQKLNNLEYSSSAELSVKELVNDTIYDSSKILKEAYIEMFDDFIRHNHQELLKDIVDLNKDIRGLGDSIPYDLMSLVQEQEKRDYTVEKIRTRLESLNESIEGKEFEISKLGYNSETYEQKKLELEELRKIAQNEIQEFGTYIPQYVEVDGNNTASRVMKGIGVALDWGVMLLPPAAYVGIASKIGKGGAVAAKVGKVLGEIDKGKDLLYALKNIGEVVKTTTKVTRKSQKRTKRVLDVANQGKNMAKHFGILDYLTLEFWGEKIGSKFDTPPTMEIDHEYELEYKQQKEILLNRFNIAKQKEIEMLQEFNLLKSNEEKIKKEKELEEKNLKKLTEELNQRKKEMRSNAERKAFDALKEQYLISFKKMLSELAETLMKKCNEVLKAPIENYFDISLSSIKYEIDKCYDLNEKMEKEYAELNNGELKSEYDKCQAYIVFLMGSVNEEV